MNANDLIPIRVSTLRGNLKIPFDAYVLINTKAILFCRKGDSFGGDRLSRLKKKKLKKMFILNDHETSYRDYLNESIQSAYDKNSGKSIEERSEIIQGNQQAGAEDVMENLHSKDVYDETKLNTANYVEYILNEDNALKSVMDIENTDISIAHHGVTVATLCISVLKKLGLEKTKPMNLITLGCLLHDVEHLYTPSPLEKTQKEMTNEELKIYKNHPTAALDRLQQHSHFDKEVLDIILNHEEYNNGGGFPQSKREKDLDVVWQVISTVNSYDRIVSFYGMDKKSAIKNLMIEKLSQHSLEHLKVLQVVLKENEITI